MFRVNLSFWAGPKVVSLNVNELFQLFYRFGLFWINFLTSDEKFDENISEKKWFKILKEIDSVLYQ